VGLTALLLASLDGPAPRRMLARAIVAVAESGGPVVPGGALAVGGGAVASRVRRLLEPPHPLPPVARFSALASSGLLQLVPTALLLAPALS
jgi:hypothetical protein